MALDTNAKREWMARVALFRGCSPDALERLAERMGEVEFPAGHHIVTQGQVGSGLYILVTGRARVLRGDDLIADLEPGDFFGELAVLDQMPRSATVIALEPTTCLGLASWDLIAELERDPQLALNLLRELAGRIRFLEDQYIY
ncbi:MAG: family transcriptional regulator, cyclic receptor protein [Chloroflexota bacterium]|jgi:CRP-like cAMP-binding protein|nr:family transcriptional regulator, cyclic receptor protein [Chloroflexota bacterium]